VANIGIAHALNMYGCVRVDLVGAVDRFPLRRLYGARPVCATASNRVVSAVATFDIKLISILVGHG